jgi:hypothetical protein
MTKWRLDPRSGLSESNSDFPYEGGYTGPRTSAMGGATVTTSVTRWGSVMPATLKVMAIRRAITTERW